MQALVQEQGESQDGYADPLNKNCSAMTPIQKKRSGNRGESITTQKTGASAAFERDNILKIQHPGH